MLALLNANCSAFFSRPVRTEDLACTGSPESQSHIAARPTHPSPSSWATADHNQTDGPCVPSGDDNLSQADQVNYVSQIADGHGLVGRDRAPLVSIDVQQQQHVSPGATCLPGKTSLELLEFGNQQSHGYHSEETPATSVYGGHHAGNRSVLPSEDTDSCPPAGKSKPPKPPLGTAETRMAGRPDLHTDDGERIAREDGVSSLDQQDELPHLEEPEVRNTVQRHELHETDRETLRMGEPCEEDGAADALHDAPGPSSPLASKPDRNIRISKTTRAADEETTTKITLPAGAPAKPDDDDDDVNHRGYNNDDDGEEESQASSLIESIMKEGILDQMVRSLAEKGVLDEIMKKFGYQKAKEEEAKDEDGLVSYEPQSGGKVVCRMCNKKFHRRCELKYVWMH